MRLDKSSQNRDPFQPQVGKGCLVAVQLVVELDRDLVNDSVGALLPYGGFYHLRFVAMYKMPGDDFLYHLHTFFYGLWIIRSAILTQQVLQHIGRNTGVAFDTVGKVLAYHTTGKQIIDLFIGDFHTALY